MESNNGADASGAKDGSGVKNVSLRVDGMTCQSCEMLVERSWKNLPGVVSVKADAGRKTVEMKCTCEVDVDKLQSSLLDQKYRVSKNDGSAATHAPSAADIAKPKPFELVGLFAVAIAFAWIVSQLGGLSGVTPGGAVSAGWAFVLGVLASFSSCLAVVSGLLIAVVAPAMGQEMNWKKRLMPLVLFLSGRFVAYAFLGGLLGWVGAKLSISPMITAILLLAAAAYMVVVGLDLLHLLPAGVKTWLPHAPKNFAHGAVDKASSAGWLMPPLLGAATFFLPCGFTQALQAYALTTGSFTSGALVLGAFALGSVPGLFALGMAVGWGKGKAGVWLTRFAGALVIVLGIVSLRSGWVLASVASEGASGSVTDNGSRITDNGSRVTDTVSPATSEQIIRMSVTRNGYNPSTLTVKSGVPVRWEIDGQPGAGCAMGIVSPSLGIEKYLNPGANVIKFYPPEPGRYAFTCPMGMYRGQIVVE